MLAHEQELLDFLRWWKAKSTAPNPTREITYTGLCFLLRYDYRARYQTCVLLKEELAKLDGGPEYPFGGERLYGLETSTRTAHLNQLRIAFVDAMIAKLAAKEPLNAVN